LNLSIDGANGFLKARGVVPSYSVADLESDLANLERTLSKSNRPR